jgi:hypothetical protein
MSFSPRRRTWFLGYNRSFDNINRDARRNWSLVQDIDLCHQVSSFSSSSQQFSPSYPKKKRIQKV